VLDEHAGMLLAMCAIDNLARGASAQAVQAFNVAEGWPDALEVHAQWLPLGDGYRLVARVALPPVAREISLDVLINLAGPGRARRRGQLVLSGGRDEFVYLRADRHDRDRLLRFVLAPP
jgi:hypothetical protein